MGAGGWEPHGSSPTACAGKVDQPKLPIGVPVNLRKKTIKASDTLEHQPTVWPVPGDMAVRMRKVLARPWVGVRVCHLLLLLS